MLITTRARYQKALGPVGGPWRQQIEELGRLATDTKPNLNRRAAGWSSPLAPSTWERIEGNIRRYLAFVAQLHRGNSPLQLSLWVYIERPATFFLFLGMLMVGAWVGLGLLPAAA